MVPLRLLTILNQKNLEANINLQKKRIKKINKYKDFNWSVWGGGVIDYKLNQIIFSTANPKPSYISKGRNDQIYLVTV